MGHARGSIAVMRRRRDVVTLVVSASTAVAAAAIADDDPVSRTERAAFAVINRLPGWLEPVMYVVQLGGLVGVPLGLAVLAAALRHWRLALALALAPPLKELLEHGVIKQLVDRRRPAATDPGAILRHDAPAAGLAFPSGHAIVAFAVAGLLAPYLPRPARIAVFGLAALICLARVYLGAHNPLDVVGGAAVGLLIASLLNLTLGTPR